MAQKQPYARPTVNQTLEYNPSLIQVNPRQKNNQLLRYLPKSKWQFSMGSLNSYSNAASLSSIDVTTSIICDYSTGSTGILYCEIEYHRLNSNYLIKRIHEVGSKYRLRVLLLLVNSTISSAGGSSSSSGITDTGSSSIREILLDINKLCFKNDFTLVLAHTLQEAARYIEAFKHQDGKPPTSIQERDVSVTSYSTSSTGGPSRKLQGEKELFLPRANKLFTIVRSCNKTSVVSLLESAKTISSIFQLDAEQMMLMANIGEKRATRLHDVFTAPFKKQRGSDGARSGSSGRQVGSQQVPDLSEKPALLMTDIQTHDERTGSTVDLTVSEKAISDKVVCDLEIGPESIATDMDPMERKADSPQSASVPAPSRPKPIPVARSSFTPASNIPPAVVAQAMQQQQMLSGAQALRRRQAVQQQKREQ